MKKLSRRFLAELKLSPTPAYVLARDADLSPFVFSRICTDKQSVVGAEEKLLSIGRALGLCSAAEVFDNN